MNADHACGRRPQGVLDAHQAETDSSGRGQSVLRDWAFERTRSRALHRLLPLKTTAEYEPDDVAVGVATKAVELAQKCVAVAQVVAAATRWPPTHLTPGRPDCQTPEVIVDQPGPNLLVIDDVFAPDTVAIFNHDVMHEGKPVERGNKTVFRSDIVFSASTTGRRSLTELR